MGGRLDLRPRRTVSFDSAKRALDFGVSAAVLLLLLPMVLVVAIAIKLESRGPVFYRCRRVGFGGAPLDMLKFRKMHADAAGGALTSPDDARFTRIGALLARTKLDELPQLWNVVHGNMSLIGPRPEMPYLVAGYQPWQHARHLIRPGITGWWQVNRSDGWLEGLLMHEATELDLYYVLHQSAWLDFVILLRTFGAVLRGSGAY